MNKLNKILKSFVLSSIILFTTSQNVFANENSEIQEEKESIKNYKGMGISAGFLSGLGFSYRQYFADNYGIKATGMGFFDQYQTFGNIGLQGMYVFSENDWLKFYGLLGVSNFSTRRNNPTYYPAEPTKGDNEYVYIPPKGTSSIDMYNSVGAGIGIELGRLEQGLSFAIELPLVATFRGTTLNSFYPIPSVSVIYNFK
jgi:hypothetical protein